MTGAVDASVVVGGDASSGDVVGGGDVVVEEFVADCYDAVAV